MKGWLLWRDFHQAWLFADTSVFGKMSQDACSKFTTIIRYACKVPMLEESLACGLVSYPVRKNSLRLTRQGLGITSSKH